MFDQKGLENGYTIYGKPNKYPTFCLLLVTNFRVSLRNNFLIRNRTAQNVNTALDVMNKSQLTKSS